MNKLWLWKKSKHTIHHTGKLSENDYNRRVPLNVTIQKCVCTTRPRTDQAAPSVVVWHKEFEQCHSNVTTLVSYYTLELLIELISSFSIILGTGTKERLIKALYALLKKRININNVFPNINILNVYNTVLLSWMPYSCNACTSDFAVEHLAVAEKINMLSNWINMQIS